MVESLPSSLLPPNAFDAAEAIALQNLLKIRAFIFPLLGGILVSLRVFMEVEEAADIVVKLKYTRENRVKSKAKQTKKKKMKVMKLIKELRRRIINIE